MNAIHSDPDVIEMAQELPMRSDLNQMELHPDSDIATAQLIIRQAVPIPLHETVIKKLKSILASILK